MKKEGIIFDLDGTLWEVIESTYYSANEIARRHGLKEIKKDTVLKVFGLNSKEVAKLYFPYLALDKAEKLENEISMLNSENLNKNGGDLYPNLKETLDELSRKYDLFIVSNTSKNEYIESFLNSSGTKKYFKDYIAASSIKVSKGEAIRKVIERNNIGNAVYVGDTVKDEEASINANIPFIQARYGFGNDLNTKYHIDSINELPKVVEEIVF